MVFRRIIFNAIFVGLLTGLLLSVVQIMGVTPIIFAAETYEVEEEAPVVTMDVVVEHHQEAQSVGHDHDAHSHDELGHSTQGHNTQGHDELSSALESVQAADVHEHDPEAWGPEDGAERTFYTVLSNVFAGIGFSAVILALMSQLQLQGITQINVMKGLAWGIAGFAAFFVAPGLGLPPEIPGTQAAAIENRQLWWVLAVICAGVGIAILAFAPVKLKLLGVLSIALPYLIGAPHITGPEFTHPDPAAVTALIELHHQFIVASGAANLVFWAALGVACAWVLNRWVLKGLTADVGASA